jgi:hypothetical protein
VSFWLICLYKLAVFVFRKHPSMGRTQVVRPVRPRPSCDAVRRSWLAHSDTSPYFVYFEQGGTIAIQCCMCNMLGQQIKHCFI